MKSAPGADTMKIMIDYMCRAFPLKTSPTISCSLLGSLKRYVSVCVFFFTSPAPQINSFPFFFFVDVDRGAFRSARQLIVIHCADCRRSEAHLAHSPTVLVPVQRVGLVYDGWWSVRGRIWGRFCVFGVVVVRSPFGT